jgi:hypothetical protein
MSITKDQASDLQSFHNAVVNRTVAYEQAKQNLEIVKANFEKFMWGLENLKEKNEKTQSNS